MTISEPLSIAPAPPENRLAVLSLVLGRLLPEDRQQRIEALLAGLRAGTVRGDGLLGARRGASLAGGVFCETQVGRTAVVWPPRLAPGEPPATALRLLEAAMAWLAGQDVAMAYALLDATCQDDAELLCRAGFERLAELVYLVSLAADCPRTRPASVLEFELFVEADHRRMARLVEATYEGTLDCPRLNGVRRIDDTLAGYRAIGTFSPGRWLFVRHQSQDVGCLLLADHAEHDNWELVYMGLVPSARGKGWGRDVARHAQWLTRRSGRQRLVLAVDAANGPALRTYSMLGFLPWDRRTVYFRLMPGAEGGSGSASAETKRT